MSAAPILAMVWAEERPRLHHVHSNAFEVKVPERRAPEISLAFYRKHTKHLLRRYLYASMQVGRAPSLLRDPIGRGWISSRRIRTFEDAVIFVLDVERCLDKLGELERQILVRVVLQSYTQAEAATLLGMSTRTMAYKFPRALDALSARLLDADLLSCES